MRRNPGAWLRERLLDRVVEVALLGAMGIAWLCGAAVALLVALGPWPRPEWTIWLVLLPGAVLPVVALYKWQRGWRVGDMKKGARAEERIGQVIEYALTRERCAVAHDVEEVASVGNIDHLMATPQGLWVIETKHGRVPKAQFRETLRRIALNVEAVRDWAPGMRVTGCLVFASEQEPRPKTTYAFGAETIRAFANPTSLMRELRGRGAGRRWFLGPCAEGLGAWQDGGTDRSIGVGREDRSGTRQRLIR